MVSGWRLGGTWVESGSGSGAFASWEERGLDAPVGWSCPREYCFRSGAHVCAGRAGLGLDEGCLAILSRGGAGPETNARFEAAPVAISPDSAQTVGFK